MIVGIIDLNICNVQSIINVLNRLNYEVVLVHSPAELQSVNKVIFPGVGSFDETISRLQASGLFQTLKKGILDETIPYFGICIGMQILFEGSAEGTCNGFGKFSGSCQKLKYSNIGWSKLHWTDNNLFLHNSHSDKFYFIHNYYVPAPINEGKSSYSDANFEILTSISSGCVHGVQFHPEKSYRAGQNILQKFLES